ncbi:GntR family transcriptional regulator [Pantoea dispersa]|uniref:GntR family transcriptional regulator n=1 Tax=Pantoea dispersa TaxID=59814 RepID=A0A8E1RWN4_9GAMM|nr:GntR family transcriptional regulator [Pantoea dispersa]BAN97579.1 transcriptional regulator, GntR family [Plautia stali symbiont]KAF0856036.1 GntR family transcriptional regulator [Pantoea dispersa 625]KTR90086.1 GntR family transcriptional regulator [Pantoea dispersa]KTS22942.1 GntR family transcriptional regulator [Pantoea dispersa]KTS57681.1 GntR family transcriptional regulator [Pantoea dispersa]
MTDHNALLARLTTTLAAESRTPLYKRFASAIKEAVRDGTLVHEEILPGEREFSQSLNISRITVRKAMDELEKEGVVFRSRGYGTQICSQFEYSLKEPKGLSQQAVLRGKTPDTVWINKSKIACSAEIAEKLGLSTGSDVYLLKRIRYVDRQAVSVEESWVPARYIADADEIGISLYDYFHRQQILPVKSQSRVSARMPDEALQQQIALPANVPVLVIKQLALDAQGNPLEYSISYCRSDMYVFIAE